MARWQKAGIIIFIVGQAIVASIQFVEKGHFGTTELLGDFGSTIVKHRFWITVITAIVTGALGSLVVVMKPYITQGAFRDSLLDGVFEQVLDNDRNKARITLFKDAGFFRTWWYRIKDLVGLWKRGWALRKIVDYCWRSNYIRIFKREGNNHKRSKTYLRVDLDSPDGCQGVAGQVRQREEDLVVSLPSLDGIDLSAVDENDPVVCEYMRLGHIRDLYVLRSIKKPAPFIYGNIISANGGRTKYVLVIDSWAKRTPFKAARRKLLSTYTKQISASFGD